MNDNNFTFLLYDKAVEDDHGITNKLTKDITIEKIFTSNHKEIEGKYALKEFNRIFTNHSIGDNLDFNIYNLHLFHYIEFGVNIRITVIEINNEKLEQCITNKKPIPNRDFLKNLCNYHSLYKKAYEGVDIMDSNFDKKKINENTKLITESAMSPNADPTDPIEQQPSFTILPLYEYQKKTIRWMLDKEKHQETIYYNNDEIIIGNIIYDNAIDDFTLAYDREKLLFKGGALIDEVGLGKTYQMISVSLCNQAKNISYIQEKYNRLFSKATLVLCPNQLGGQWTREIETVIKKNYGVNIVTFFTKNHHDKYTYQEVLDADFVIVSFNFLGNRCFLDQWVSKLSTKKSYLTSKLYNFTDCEKMLNQDSNNIKKITTLSETQVNLLLIQWHRIVVDEIHEIYTNTKMSYIMSILPLFQAEYKWCITATPFDKSEECLLKMLQYVTNTSNKIDSKIFKNKTITEYLAKKFFRRNTKKSVVNENKLPPLKENIVWLNFSKTEWMIYNAYMANPNVDKFGTLIRQICCHPKLADEIKLVVSNCKSLEDIEKAMVKLYETQMKKAHGKVKYLEYRIKKTQRKIKILELKRQRTLIKKLGYRVKVEFDNDNILSKEEVSLLEKELADDPYIANMLNNNIIDEENPFDDDSDEENEKIKKKKLFTISENNQHEVKKLIGIDLQHIPESIFAQMDIEKNFKDSLNVAMIDYKGKKSTYDYFNDVISKLKVVSENLKIKNPNDDTDSDEEDDTQQNCGICLDKVTGHDCGVTKCGHIFCYNCIKPYIEKYNKCPVCQKIVKSNEIFMVEQKIKVFENKETFKDKQALIERVGTKLANLIFFLKQNGKHSIIFSQWDDLLRKIGEVLDEYNIKNVFCRGNVWQRDKAIREFNSHDDIKVIMLSSESAASGTNLTKAENVILVDPVYGSYEYRRNTEWQAIGRAYRTGQTKTVNVMRFIVRNTVEESIYNMNKDEDNKSPVDTIKLEMTDETIILDKNKLDEINEAVKDSEKKNSEPVLKKAIKTTKAVSNAKKIMEHNTPINNEELFD